jgi:L-amino acid N-acyltransferase YncA
VIVRLAVPRDAESITAIYRPAVTESAISFEAEAPDAGEMAARVEATLRRTPWLVGEEGGRVIGYVYANPHAERAAYRWSANVSAYVDPGARRNGVARALYTSLFAVLVLQGYRNAYAGITLPNAASEGLHRALGFTLVGVYHSVGYKRGAWHDVGWFERQLALRDLDPPPPVPLPALVGTDALTAALASGPAALR